MTQREWVRQKPSSNPKSIGVFPDDSPSSLTSALGTLNHGIPGAFDSLNYRFARTLDPLDDGFPCAPDSLGRRARRIDNGIAHHLPGFFDNASSLFLGDVTNQSERLNGRRLAHTAFFRHRKSSAITPGHQSDTQGQERICRTVGQTIDQ